MRASVLGALLLLGIAGNVNAVAACINDDCTPRTLPYPLPALPDIAIPVVPTQQICVWANDEPETCLRLETDHLSVCWSSAQFACKNFESFIGVVRLCIRWNDYSPSCFTVSDMVEP